MLVLTTVIFLIQIIFVDKQISYNNQTINKIYKLVYKNLIIYT